MPADHPSAEGTVTADALADVKRLWHELTANPHDPGNLVVTPALYDSLDRLSEYGEPAPAEGILSREEVEKLINTETFHTFRQHEMFKCLCQSHNAQADRIAALTKERDIARDKFKRAYGILRIAFRDIPNGAFRNTVMEEDMPDLGSY